MNRTCSRCKTDKPLEDFPKAGRPNDVNLGYEGVCKTCVAARLHGETRRCKTCRKVLPLEEFRIYKDDKREHHCRACRNAYEREHRLKDKTFREPRRKLPDYDTLKTMFIDKGMSYQQIAAEYGVTWGTVNRTLRAKAMRRGEWPLLSPREVQDRMGRGRRRAASPGEYRVGTFALAEAIQDYMAEHNINMGEFAERAGLTGWYVRSIAGAGAKVVNTTSPAYAVRILEVCGERVPADLRRRASKGPQPGPLPTRQTGTDEEACASSPSASPDVTERVG